MITAAVSPQNLLIVDDERAQLQTLSDIFADEGFEVCACATFEEALDQCQDHSFAVAILDLRLGAQDGIELLSRIRQAQPGIRTIIHTAYGSLDSAKNAINVRAFAYVEKQGDPSELVSQVHRAVKDLLSEALTQSEQRFRDLLNDVVAIVWECELPSWRFTFVSQHAEAILGYPVAQWLDEPDFWVNHIHGEDRERCVKLCRDSTERGEDHQFDYRAVAADGRIVWLHDIVHIVKDESGTPIWLRGVMFDITEKKQAEEALHQSESRYRSLVESSPVCIHEVDLLARLTSINPVGLQMVGFDDKSAVVGRDYMSFVEETDRARIESLMKQAYQGVASSFEFTCRVNGEPRLFSSNFIPIVGESGAVEKLMGTTEDITDRVEAERKLRESESRFRTIFEQAAVGVALIETKSGRFVKVNHKYTELIGYSNEEMIQRTFMDITHPEDLEPDLANMRKLHAGEIAEFSMEKRFIRKDGSAIWGNLTVSPTWRPGAEQRFHIAIVEDISERKLAEEQLREREAQLAHISRLTTMGEMVAGIAHEINQPLSAIANFAQACEHTMKTTDYEYDVPIETWLQQVNEQAVRCGDIIRRLRAFVKKSDDDREWADLNRVVRDTVALIGSDLRHQSVVIDCRLPNPGPRVHANHVQLQQVLLNLLQNACDATSETTTPQISVHVDVEHGRVRLTVEDNGPGIEEAQQEKLFDAFFTTKPDGMGMGLAISKSIVEAHGGSLRFDPETSSGATFHIQLPAAEGAKESEQNVG